MRERGEQVRQTPRDLRLGIAARRLRARDDRGNVYDHVLAPGSNDRLELGPGESISGDLTFVGPLSSHAGSSQLLWGVGDHDLRPGTDGSFPAFALGPFELRW